MSLCPFFDDSYSIRPSRLLNQNFGLVLDPEDILRTIVNPRLVVRCPAGYVRNWVDNVPYSGSTVSVLTITAPKVGEDNSKQHREIPIQQTGEPLKRVEQKKEEQKKEEQKGEQKNEP